MRNGKNKFYRQLRLDAFTKKVINVYNRAKKLAIDELKRQKKGNYIFPPTWLSIGNSKSGNYKNKEVT